MKYPKEWPGVECTQCKDTNGFNYIIEMTSPRLFGTEVPGWDVECGFIHWAHDPRPLTPAAEAMLAIASAGAK